MENKRKLIHLNFKEINWKIPLLVLIACFYLAGITNGILIGNKFAAYRGDFIAFWSVGKIASEKGYSEIYDLNTLQTVQSQGVNSLGFIETIDGPSNPTIPVPYFSFFIIPFQLLAKVPIIYGFWLWTIFNLIVIAGYLVLFVQKINPGRVNQISPFYLICLALISYPVLINFLTAQVEAILVICAGEFIRSAIGKRPVLAGIWLGGLLLKPQLLIIIIPVLLIFRYWKVLIGFIASSGVILLTSLVLSGFSGMKALINLWTKYSSGMASNSPEAMINWRMLGININTFTNTSIGWVVTGLGMVATILAVYFLIKKNPTFGSPQWVLSMLGIFSATLALTWHSHYHMAMVLLPFLVFVTEYQLLPQNVTFSWATGPQVVLLGIIMIEGFLKIFLRTNGLNLNSIIVIAFSGFILNTIVLIFTLRSSND